MSVLKTQINVDLTAFNTMGFSVNALQYIDINSDDELSELLLERENPLDLIDCFILGGGSNLVLTRDVSSLVLHMRQKGIKVISEDEEYITVAVAAGENWHEFVMTCLSNGWLGLENLALIPGAVGACPVQNIGAYGVEVKDTIEEVKAWDREKQLWVVLKNKQCQFSYRDSVFKQPWRVVDGHAQSRYVITEVIFKLIKDVNKWQPKISYGDVASTVNNFANGAEINAHHVAQAIISIRQSKLPNPAELGNAGSFFKNPVVSSVSAIELKQKFPNMPMYPQADETVKIAAGWLIEQVGYKGRRKGHVGVYDKQALVLVHYGQGTGVELMSFAQEISDAVYEKFAVRISPEPIVY